MIFNFFSKPVFEGLIFKKHSEAYSLTPSFALEHTFKKIFKKGFESS